MALKSANTRMTDVFKEKLLELGARAVLGQKDRFILKIMPMEFFPAG
jgi:hypothetical protein